MSTSSTVRPSFHAASADHLHELLRMMHDMQQDDPWSCGFDEAIVRETLQELLSNPDYGRVWIIVADDETVGYIVMSFDYSLEYRGRNAWVDEFFIRPAYRGRGVGALAMDYFLEQANALGVKCVHLQVNPGNPAIELYRRKGFEEHERAFMTKWIAEKP